MERLPFMLPTLDPGWVWLTGAGPGDPGLLTLQALTGIQQADLIVHDALVSDKTLALAGPNCDIVYAGKRGGKPSPKQPDISARLVAFARAGKRVVRLKGGILSFSAAAGRKRWRWWPPEFPSGWCPVFPLESADWRMPGFR